MDTITEAATTARPAPGWATAAGLVALTPPRSPGGEHGGPALDRLLIAERIARYGWAYDERDQAALAECFTADATWRATVMGEIEVLHAVLGVHLEVTGAAQYPVEVDGPADVGDAVLGQGDHGASLGLGVLEQRGERRVEVGGGPERARVLGAEALQVVVEMRYIAQRQVGMPGAVEVPGRVDDLLAGDEVGARAPEVEQRERAECGVEFVVQLGRAACIARPDAGHRLRRLDTAIP
jgi:hypothetical protein